MHASITIFWLEFGILFAAAFLGGVAVLPYALRLMRGSAEPKALKMSISAAMLLSVLQNAIISAIAVGTGLLAAHAIGLGAPYIAAALAGTAPPVASMLQAAILLGLLAGAALLVGDLLFLPYWPQPLVDTARRTTLWENFTASFYGGINEELLLRLFGFSVVAWSLSKVWQAPTPIPIFWIANVLMALLFAIGHLPALRRLAGRISGAMLFRALLLNTPIGLLCGWLFWSYGIEAAIVAHFSADIVYHVFGTIVLRRKLDASASRA